MKPITDTYQNNFKTAADDVSGCGHAVKFIADAVPEPVIILNHERRLVAFNSSAASVLGNADELVGKLPGEVLGCSHAVTSHDQCGTMEFCKHCGANSALKESLSEVKTAKECSILKTDGEVMDLQVTSTPMKKDGLLYLFVYIKDLSDSKRKAILERLFFHDIMNMLSGISTVSDIMETTDSHEEIRELASIMRMTSVSLTDEIRSHKLIFEAESGGLSIRPEKVSSAEILSELQTLYSAGTVCIDKSIVIDPAGKDIHFTTDKTILNRVLGNLLKNALEAVPAGGSVKAGSYPSENGVEFRVYNKGFIPRDIQARLFHRNVSTKGAGRGLGTHSVKLLSEKYLKGHVGFSSSETLGTVFRVVYPHEIK